MPGRMYHVLSRANGSEKMFYEDKNFEFFLQKMQTYILPVSNFISYNLLPNHFHFIVEMKTETEIRDYFRVAKPLKLIEQKDFPKVIMQQYANLLNSYCKALNKTYSRKGSLFINCLRRVQIETEEQFFKTLLYVHNNAVNHGYCNSVRDWPWSSYHSVLSDCPSFLCKGKLLDKFHGKEDFQNFHNTEINRQSSEGSLLEKQVVLHS